MHRSLLFLYPFILILCFFLCSCDLSHKHYLDNYGVCKSCNQDVCILLSNNVNGEYISEIIDINPYNDVFVKFVSTGDMVLKLILIVKMAAK